MSMLTDLLNKEGFGLESDDFEEPKKKDDVEIREIDTKDEVPQAGFIDEEEATLVAESDQIREDGDKAERAMASLESLYSALNEAMEEGGLSAQGARMATLFADQYVRDTGNESPVASTEAFGGSSSRFNATRISMEGVGEAIKKGWAAFIELMKKLGRFIMESTQRITFAAQRIESGAKKLFEVARKTKETKGKVDIGGNRMLFVEGKFDSNGGTTVAAAAKLIYEAYPKAVKGYLDAAGNAVNSIKNEADLEAFKKSLSNTSYFVRLGTKVAKAPFSVSDNATVYSSRPLPGNMAMYIVETPGDFGKSVGIHLEKSSEAAKIPESYEVSARAPSEIANELSKVILAARTVINGVSIAKGTSVSIDRISDILGKVEEANVQSKARKLVESMRGLVGKQYTGTRLYLIRAMSAQVKLAARELKAEGADADEQHRLGNDK